MLDIVKKTSPEIGRWLQTAEKDAKVDPILVSMLQSMEANPDLVKLLVLAKDLVASKEMRLVGLATLLIGKFDHPRAHSFMEVLLANNDARLRICALEAAALGGSLWGLRKCLSILGDRDVNVARSANALMKSWTNEQVRTLIEQLLERGDTASYNDAAEALFRVADVTMLDLLEKAFEKVDLTLKRKLSRGLMRMATPEIIAWTRELAERLRDPDGKKLLEMALVEMNRGGGAAPGPSASTGEAPGAQSGGHAGHSAPHGAEHAPAPAHAAAQPPAPPPPPAAPVAQPSSPSPFPESALTSSPPPDRVARITNRRIFALDIPISPPSSVGDLIPVDLPAPEQLVAPVAPRSRAAPIPRDALLTSVTTTPADKERIHALLKELVTQGASDLHVIAGKPPSIRRDGELHQLPGPVFTTQQLTAGIAAVSHARQFERYVRDGDLDLSIGVAGAGRFRINFLKSRGVPGMVARLIPSEVPSLAELKLPEVLNQLALEPKGILLVTGPTGSGKATTLATLVDLINSSRRGHIVTLDDPLEFIHRDRQCTVTQREMATDVKSFADGIRFASRMDADVILVGDLRERETIRAAFNAAGAGRLVLASGLAGSSTKAIASIVAAFPPDEQAQARINVATHLLAVIAQHLLHAQKGGGRIPAHEVLVVSPVIRKAIRDNQPQLLYTQIETGATQGMVTLEQSLVRLLKAGTITREEAFSRASDPAMLSNLI